jgi:hypothetical protein
MRLPRWPLRPTRSGLPYRVQYHDEKGGDWPQKQGEKPPVHATSTFCLRQTGIDEGKRKPADSILTSIWVHIRSTSFRTWRIRCRL